MRYKQISIIMLFLLGIEGLSIGQNSETINNTSNPKESSTPSQQLIGTWELIKTIVDDSTEYAPSLQLWKTPNAQPVTTIQMDSALHFKIEQTCMKCPLLVWSGILNTWPGKFNGVWYLYLHFADSRFGKKTRQQETELTFNGYLTHLENNLMIITDHNKQRWVYQRFNE